MHKACFCRKIELIAAHVCSHSQDSVHAQLKVVMTARQAAAELD